ncbi:hypothetical protein EMIHUDRAFT_455795 [Emiliania huxleyi CCMP1516]|uniref:IMP-specific 5'-nucleotidase 1 n=2 Tax=Emiliania huxleyi TaxID=2903 RepID=A0A0D3KCL7_EMIH1|nr:hypothetical protein EMIHUDRAFT_455795 [Emiliania huxleyi CCMP1516]EOD33502.1 hypothetical protein EMIHUDRAFT_455795 [Emiliania huxleyi CCMP1516]|eukprot:XP_005785931.1 hypothetical protein EMIHUDRAFT_455795 [Emiliania huxleyi CCMP1516]
MSPSARELAFSAAGALAGIAAMLALQRALLTGSRAVTLAMQQSEEDQGEITRGRAKHDMTPSQLARRQAADPLISLMLDLLDRLSLTEACAVAEDLIAEHLEAAQREDAPPTELSTLAPRQPLRVLVSNEFGRLWQPLHLREALIDYDNEAHVTCRQYVPATFRELRNICNLAQALCSRVFVVGGQCNYLARCRAEGGVATLYMVPPSEWRLPEMERWRPQQLQRLLDVAQRALLDGAARMHMADKVKLVRKERAVGVLYEAEKHRTELHRTTTLMLDELAVHARQAVREEQRTNAALRSMPFCAFNGGRDVFVDVGSKDLGIFVDVGSKDLGIASLQRIVGATPQSTLHMGDQFTQTGNDLLARRACGTLWVDSPEETAVLLRYMLRMRAKG